MLKINDYRFSLSPVPEMWKMPQQKNWKEISIFGTFCIKFSTACFFGEDYLIQNYLIFLLPSKL